jgi:hypothetical protein
MVRQVEKAPDTAPGATSFWILGLAMLTSVGALVLMGISFTVDIRSFRAMASPDLYCLLILCVVCLVAGAAAVQALIAGIRIPLHFWIVLLIGIGGIVWTAKPAVRIIFKEAAEGTEYLEEAHLDLRNKTVRDKSFAEANLRHSVMSGATFHHVDFSGADLSETDLRRARFENVDLSGARLCGVDLRGADLRGAYGIKAVADWSYVFYNRKTLGPPKLEEILHYRSGPIPDTGHDLLYMCKQDITRRVR